MSDAQENTNMRLMKMANTIQNLKTKFNREIQTLERTQDEIKME